MAHDESSLPPSLRRDPVEWWSGRLRELVEDPDTPDELLDPKRDRRRGWGRASFDLNTRSGHRKPQITQEDLLLPSARDRVQLFAACLFCGAAISVLWVYFPIMLVAIPFDLHLGAWPFVAMGAAAALGTVVLFLYASRVDRRAGERALARF
jgi:hypothetical protein